MKHIKDHNGVSNLEVTAEDINHMEKAQKGTNVKTEKKMHTHTESSSSMTMIAPSVKMSLKLTKCWELIWIQSTWMCQLYP